jgi:hypothetical protein
MTIARVYNTGTGSQPNVLTGAEQTTSFVTAKAAQAENNSTLPQNHDSQSSAQPKQAEHTNEANDDAACVPPDLSAAIRAAQSYPSSALNTNETRLALDAAMTDMKAAVLIQRGLVSDESAQQLLGSQEAGHKLLLDRMDAYLEQREAASVHRGGPPGAYPPADRALFQSMYDAVLHVFRNSGGDVSAAIRVGAAFGQAAAARAGAAHPAVQRWGVSAESFWKNFFNSPSLKQDPAQRKAVQGLSQVGLHVPWVNSPYQNYMQDWRDFLEDLDGQGAFLVDAQA